MNPRDTWQGLQSHLSAARVFLDAGEHDRALGEVEAALTIDAQFLAAQSLRERILAAAPFASSQRAPLPVPEPALAVPGRTAAAAVDAIDDLPLRPDPIQALPPEMQPAETPGISLPLIASDQTERIADIQPPEIADVQPARTADIQPASPPDAGYAKFEQRAKRRRVDRRLDAARAAIAERRLHEATGALDEVRDLDPNAPELPELVAALNNLRSGSAAPRRGAWLAAALVFGVTVFAASWLEENQRALLSHPMLAVSGLVDTPAKESVPHPADEATASAAAANLIPGDALATSAGADETTNDAATPSGAVSAPAAEQEPPIRLEPAGTTGHTVIAPSAASPPANTATYAGAAPPAVPTPTPPPPAPLAPAQLHAALPAAATPSSAVPLNDVASSAVSSAAASSLSADTPPVAMASQRMPVVDEASLVRQALQRYRVAYDGLDAGSAQAVWPAVNEGALAKAFEGLESQTLTFDECRVQLQTETATATCRGTTRYVPKVGSREPRTEPRVWNFSLRKNGGEWKIDNARVDR